VGRIEQLSSLIAEVIGETSDRDGAYLTAIPGLYLSKLSTSSAPRYTIDRAVFCVIAQGVKSILLNNERYLYDPNKYLVISLDLPAIGEIVKATREKPFLGLTMELDFTEIGTLSLEASVPSRSDLRHQRGLFVSPLDADFLDAVIRLVCLLKKPSQIPILAPLVRREIFYRLLLSEQSGFLRRMTAENSQVRRIAAGLEWLKKNATRGTVRADEALGRSLGVQATPTLFIDGMMLKGLRTADQLREAIRKAQLVANRKPEGGAELQCKPALAVQSSRTAQRRNLAETLE